MREPLLRPWRFDPRENGIRDKYGVRVEDKTANSIELCRPKSTAPSEHHLQPSLRAGSRKERSALPAVPLEELGNAPLQCVFSLVGSRTESRHYSRIEAIEWCERLRCLPGCFLEDFIQQGKKLSVILN